MNLSRSLLLVLLVLIASPSLAVEGMWQPHQLQQLAGQLEELGLEIEPGRLSDLTEHPMNAVISLGGCTASFVSPNGLVVTNYHCAYGAIQYNSRADANLEETGFLAAGLTDELPAGPGRRILVTVEVEDVTEKMASGLEELGGRARYQQLEDREKLLVAACEEDPGHRCNVSSFHGGLQYYLTKQLEIRDVRLSYAPAGAIGQYGGDIDNWIWPRHTGDFAFYRAYVGPDGKPADYSEDNVPYRPKHHLKVSAEGLQPDSFVMVVGYPGRTNRYRTATEVAEAIGWSYPTRKARLDRSLAILERATADSPDAAIKYAGMSAGLNNATKNYAGLLEGFSKSGSVERKQHREQELRSWIESDPQRAKRYLPTLDALAELIVEQRANRERNLYYGGARRAALLSTAARLYRLSVEKQKPDADREPGYQERDSRRIKSRLERLERSFAPEVDRALWRNAILEYAEISPDQHVAEFDEWFSIGTGQEASVDVEKLDARLDEMYAATKLGELEQRLAWLDASPKKFEKSDDPFIRLAVKLYDNDRQREEQNEEVGGQLNLLRSRYMSVMIDFLDSQGRPVYPDANGTLRVSFGTVQGYSPRDASSYTPFTTLRGILEKDTGEHPFNSPPAQLEAIRARSFGRYHDERLDSVSVNFLSDLDTTGGNSGSATLNAKAELVGLLFDGNWESIIADWDFIPEITRSIHVDARYMLWVMTQVDGAHHLVREMGLPVDQPAE